MKDILCSAMQSKANSWSLKALELANISYQRDLGKLAKFTERGSSKASKISALFCGVRNDQLRAMYFLQLARKSKHKCCWETASLGLCEVGLKAKGRGVKPAALQVYFTQLLWGKSCAARYSRVHHFTTQGEHEGFQSLANIFLRRLGLVSRDTCI